MKNIHLYISKPCHESWHQMLPEAQGRHCLACQKTVVDFSAMTDAEIVSFFKVKPAAVCGRFLETQLVSQFSVSKPAAGWKNYLLAFTATLAFKFIITDAAKAQARTEQGVPKPEINPIGTRGISTEPKLFSARGTVRNVADGSPVCYVLVTVKGTDRRAITDAEGKFALTGLKDGDVLYFRGGGFKSQSIAARPEVEVEITIPPVMKFITGGIVMVPERKNVFQKVKSWFQR